MYICIKINRMTRRMNLTASVFHSTAWSVLPFVRKKLVLSSGYLGLLNISHKVLEIFQWTSSIIMHVPNSSYDNLSAFFQKSVKSLYICLTLETAYRVKSYPVTFMTYTSVSIHTYVISKKIKREGYNYFNELRHFIFFVITI